MKDNFQFLFHRTIIETKNLKRVNNIQHIYIHKIYYSLNNIIYELNIYYIAYINYIFI
jgi:hypothetical protein